MCYVVRLYFHELRQGLSGSVLHLVISSFVVVLRNTFLAVMMLLTYFYQNSSRGV